MVLSAPGAVSVAMALSCNRTHYHPFLFALLSTLKRRKSLGKCWEWRCVSGGGRYSILNQTKNSLQN